MGDLGSFLNMIGPILGIGNSLGLFGGNRGGQSQPTTGDVSGANDALKNFMQQLGMQIGNVGGIVQPQFANAFNNLMGIDMSPFYRAAGDTASQYGNLAQEFAGMGHGLANQANMNIGGQAGLMGAGNQLWQTALDPQNALFNRTAQQMQDFNRAGTSARGLGTTPYAAGLENDSMRNFLIDWQNQQLGRQATGLQGMSQAYGQGANLGNLAGRDVTSAAGMLGQVPQMSAASAQVPFELQAQAGGWPGQVASQFGNQMQQQLYGPESTFMQLLDQYMGRGQTANQINFGQGQTNLANLIGGFGSLGNIMGGFGQPQTQPFPWQSFSQFGQPLEGGQMPYGGAGSFADPGAGY